LELVIDRPEHDQSAGQGLTVFENHLSPDRVGSSSAATGSGSQEKCKTRKVARMTQSRIEVAH
jgi:hypothetical protein